MPKKLNLVENPFFTFLKSVQQNQSKKSPIQVSIQSNRDSIEYAFIPFAVSHQNIYINNTFFHVVENHITVFSDYTDFSLNSEYHYTATLEDQEGAQYKLRSYFDKNNNSSESLAFKTLPPLGTQEVSIPVTSETHPILKMWIQAEANTVISPLAAQQHKKISELTTVFDGEIAPLLDQFEHVKDDMVALVELQNQTKKLSQKEKKIIQLTPEFKSLLLSSLKESIEWRKAEINMEKTQAAQLQEQPPMTANASSGALETTNLIPSKASHSKKKKKSKASAASHNSHLPAKHGTKADDFQNEFTQLLRRYETATYLTEPTSKAHSLMAFFTDVNGLECRLHLLGSAEEKMTLSLPLQTIKSDVTQQVQALMHEAIDSNTSEILTFLSGFTKLAAIEVLQYAIDTNNSKLIDDAFAHYPYAINRLSLTLPDTGIQVAPLVYAYEIKAEHAFDALLKQSANPFVRYANNLPLMHHILKNISDGKFFPLMHQKIFELGHMPIMAQLIKTLEDELQTNVSLSMVDKDALTAAIRDYTSIQQIPAHASLKISSKIARTNAQLSSELNECISPDLVRELEADHEYQDIKQQYISAQIEFLSNLSKTDYYKLNSAGKSMMFGAIENKAIVKAAISRDSLITIFKSFMAIFPKQARLMAIQKITNNPRSNNAAKKLQQESNTLEQDIKMLNTQIEQAASKQVIKSSFSDILQELSNIGEIFAQAFSETVDDEMPKVDFLANALADSSDDEFEGIDFLAAALEKDNGPARKPSGKETPTLSDPTGQDKTKAPATTLLATSMETSIFTAAEKIPAPTPTVPAVTQGVPNLTNSV